MVHYSIISDILQILVILMVVVFPSSYLLHYTTQIQRYVTSAVGFRPEWAREAWRQLVAMATPRLLPGCIC